MFLIFSLFNKSGTITNENKVESFKEGINNEQ